MPSTRRLNSFSKCRLCDVSGYHETEIWELSNAELNLNERVFQCTGVQVCRYAVSSRQYIHANVNDHSINRQFLLMINFQIRRSDDTSKICEQCLNRVNKFFRFRESCAARNTINTQAHFEMRIAPKGCTATVAVAESIDTVYEPIVTFEISSDDEFLLGECNVQSDNSPNDTNPVTPMMCIEITDTESDNDKYSAAKRHASRTANLSAKRKTKSKRKIVKKKNVGKFHVKCRGHCKDLFESKDAMMFHMNSYHVKGIKRIFACHLCKKIFTERKTLFHHMNAVHSRHKRFVCPFQNCTKICYYKENLDKHIKHLHAKRHLPTTRRKKPPKSCVVIKQKNAEFPINCAFGNCREIFENEGAMMYHVENSHSKGIKKLFECFLCKKSSPDRINLYQHMNAMHGRQIEFKCPYAGCLAVFKFSSGVPRHIKRIHTTQLVFPAKSKHIVNGKVVEVQCNGDTVVKCAWNTCPNFFESKDAMIYHVGTYHAKGKKRSIECHLCKIKYANMAYLQDHMNGVHSLRKTFTCPLSQCSKVFHRNINLIGHMRNSHKRERICYKRKVKIRE